MDLRPPPLPDVLLRPLQELINRNIMDSTPARELLPSLADRVLGVYLKDTPIALHMLFHDSGVTLSFAPPADPDVILSGGLLGLARLTGDDAGEAFRSGAVELIGEAEMAHTIQELLQHAHPDWEEELSRLVGDVAAHQVGNMARGIFGWSKQAGESVQRNATEYLQEESRDLVAPAEARDFCDTVDTVRDDVERAAARLDRLEKQLNTVRES